MLKQKLPNSSAACMMESLEARRLFSAVLGVAAAATPVAVASGLHAAPQSGLQVVLGSEGISQLSYNGDVLFSQTTHPNDVFNVFEYSETIGGQTTIYSGSQVQYTTSWDAPSQTLTLAFNWGTVAVKYTVTATKVSMAIHVQNTTTDATINGLNIAPLALYFAQMPAGYNGQPQVTCGTENPAITIANFGVGDVAMVEEDVNSQLYSGFLAHNIFDLGYEAWVASTPLPGMPTSWPIMNQPIAPGASDTYNISLRFGPTNSTDATLAPDVLAAYAAANPDTVKWTNRNPIGMLFPSGQDAAGPSATNPRNWFCDPNINVTTPAGLAAFSTQLLAYAANSIEVLKSMGAQGMITWDIEGQQYINTGYVGDPNMATTLAPELAYNNLVGQYFAMFRNAGFETGVTIRPQVFVYNNGNPYQETVTGAAEVATLVSKIQYAQTNWGCTLFYIDSTYCHDSPAVLEEVHEECPNVLLIPENSNTGEYSAGAPFGQIRTAPVTLPTVAAETYSKAFMVIDTTVASPGVMNETQLLDDVRDKDILMFNGWYNSAANAMVQAAYKSASKSNSGSSNSQKSASNPSVGASQDSSSPIADLLSSASDSLSDLLKPAHSHTTK